MFLDLFSYLFFSVAWFPASEEHRSLQSNLCIIMDGNYIIGYFPWIFFYQFFVLFFADFDTSNVENDSSTLEETSKITHMVRGTWFSKSDQPYTYDLPSRLLTHLRAVLNCQNAESPAEISRIDVSFSL